MDSRHWMSVHLKYFFYDISCMWFLKDIFTFIMCIEINEWMNIFCTYLKKVVSLKSIDSRTLIEIRKDTWFLHGWMGVSYYIMEVAIKDILSGPATNTFTPPPFRFVATWFWSFKWNGSLHIYLHWLTQSSICIML